MISYSLVATFSITSQCFHLIKNLYFSNYERKTKKKERKFPSFVLNKNLQWKLCWLYYSEYNAGNSWQTPHTLMMSCAKSNISICSLLLNIFKSFILLIASSTYICTLAIRFYQHLVSIICNFVCLGGGMFNVHWWKFKMSCILNPLSVITLSPDCKKLKIHYCLQQKYH